MNDPVLARDRVLMAMFLSVIIHVLVLFGPMGGAPKAPVINTEPLTLELQLEPAAESELRLFAEAAEAADNNASAIMQPNQRHIDGTTDDGPAARYLRDWIVQAETIGNQNYPEALRQQGLSGRVVMAVTLNAQGEVVETRIMAGSENPALHQAANELVRAAAPYAAVPSEVLQGNDALVITRAWSFGE